MDQSNSNSNSNGAYGPYPPPYDHQDYKDSSCTGMSYQVGKGDIVVVSPPGHCENVLRSPGVEADGGNEQNGQASPVYSYGLEDSGVGDSGFSDAAIRRGFIRKVYLTLFIQLILTVGIIFPFVYWSALRDWVWFNSWFYFTMMATVLVLIISLSCCDNLRRQVPLNFCALGLFTIAEGLMLGSVAAYFTAEAVGWAVGATALVSLALSLFSLQSKFPAPHALGFTLLTGLLVSLSLPSAMQMTFNTLAFVVWDFTAVNASLWVFIWTVFSFGLLCAILRSQFLSILYACLGTLLFSFYLVFDTQLILGGKHRKYAVSPEEYIFAALNLYLDIVSLFLMLLQLIGLCR